MIRRSICSMEDTETSPMDASIDSSETSNESLRCGLEFTLSNKGKPQLIHKGYLFKCNKTTDKKKYWLCIESRCGVSLHTTLKDVFLVINGIHKHVENPDDLQVKILRSKMKERILLETTPITKIYDEEICKANLSHGAAAIIPTVVEFRMYCE